MVKVLHELASLDGSGVAKIICDYYRYIDHDKVHFDFLVYDYYEEGIMEKDVLEMGCKIYKCTAYQKNKEKYLQEIEEVFKHADYDVFQSHIGPQSFFSMPLAKKYGIPKRYVHSHYAVKIGKTLRNRLSVWVQDQVSVMKATDLFACGKEAARVRFERHMFNTDKVHIMTNAIDTEKFKFNPEKREALRKDMDLEGKFVLGIVGRLEAQKNYPFLFEVLKEYVKKDSNVILLVIGRGAEEEFVRQKAKESGVEDHIRFLGVRSDVPELLNAMDVFVLPSLYEGLPIVLVEAQANGLLELAADTITDEMEVTDLIQYLPINDSKVWADTLITYKDKKVDRSKYAKEVAKNGYDIRTEAKVMEEFYQGGKVHG